MNRKGKTIILRFMYLVIIMLILQVLKVVFNKSQSNYSFFIAIIISCLQCLTLMAFILVPLFTLLFRKFTPRRPMLYAGILFIVLIAGMEWLFASWLNHPAGIPGFLRETFRVYYFIYDQNIIQLDPKSSVYDRKLFYTLRPNSSSVFENREFRTHISANAAGVRDDNASLQQPAIICLGDSYTLGWGVEEPETFCHRIETVSGLKTLNTGISSYGTAREIISLTNFDLSQLQYLVVQYCGNDDGENIPFLKKNALDVSSQGFYDSITVINRINKQYFPGKHFLVMGQLFCKQQINRIHPFFPIREFEGSGLKEESVRLFLDVLAKAPIDRSKVKIVAFHLDPLARLDGHFAYYTDSLLRTPHYKEIFGDNMRAIDLKNVLSDSDYFRMDVHLNPRGQAKVADKVLSVMKNWSAGH